MERHDCRHRFPSAVAGSAHRRCHRLLSSRQRPQAAGDCRTTRRHRKRCLDRAELYDPQRRANRRGLVHRAGHPDHPGHTSPLARRRQSRSTHRQRMSLSTVPRILPWDWYKQAIPESVAVDDTAFLETSYSFLLYRSELPDGVRIGRGSTTYLGTMFDLGPRGRVTIGDYSLVHGAWFICDSEIT